MFRFVVSIILIVVFAGASTASVMHGLDHGSDHADHHAEMTEVEMLASAGKALADCCDTTNGMGSMPCFGDLVATSADLPVMSACRTSSAPLYGDFTFSNLTLAVPTGPPRV